ncbi:MAG: DUF1365 family protein, partial [Candidatus Omnitrophica bacterium]|nr:DUF1365 family protein [Candidatus Omnitrophota bacterium]
PFTNLDDSLDFSLAVPDKGLCIRVDTSRDGEKYVMAAMTGERRELNLANLLWYVLRFPFETVAVISLIHWHAVLLYLKKTPFHLKENQPHLQKGVYRGWHKN